MDTVFFQIGINPKNVIKEVNRIFKVEDHVHGKPLIQWDYMSPLDGNFWDKYGVCRKLNLNQYGTLKVFNDMDDIELPECTAKKATKGRKRKRPASEPNTSFVADADEQ